MSHPFPNRGESFNFAFYNEPNYHQIPQFQISTAEKLLPEWDPFSRPKSVHGVRNQAPSPIASVHSTRTAPNPRLSDFMAFYPSNPSPTNNDGSIGIQNGSSMLDPNYLSGAFNPSLQADSWNTFNLRSNEENRVRSASCQSDIGLLPYPPPGSGIDKRGLPSDEGYHSLKSSHSVRSNEPDFAGQDFPMNTLSQVGHMTVDNGLSGGTGMSRMPSDQISRVSSTRSRKSTSKPLKCVYDGCDEISKSNSEYRKHLLKHEKPHKCYVHNCRRDGKGFATINDLDRHKKSVHGIDIDKKSWKCAAERCKSREKCWPRLDNFKQHVRRMHKDEDELDFIKRSTWDPEKQIFDTTDEPTVAPMDTNFALAGLGKSFASGSPVCSMPSYDVLSERGNQRWPSSEQDQHTREKALQSLQFLNVPSPMPRNTVSLGQSRGQRRAPGLSKQTQSSLPTDVERDIAPEESISQAPQAKPDHGLSNAPQTKAEQQRSALQKLSQAVSTQSNPVNLERIILDILHKATDSAKWDGKSKRKGRQGSDGQSDSNAVTLTKSDALAASQMISNLIKQSPGSAQAAPRQASKGFILNPKICTHEGCKYKSARDCDMRKHMKRHARPYGCTFPKCHKRFGAKSDWKRHENSQHFQLEAFRCAHEMPSGKVCGVHLHRQQAFENHLESHGFSSKNWGEVVRRSKIGKNRQGSFWCGFCNLVTELKTRRNAAWDERFDHIARHFEKDKKSIEDWVCAEENKTKKELLREMDRYVYDDDDDGDERERDEDLDASGEEDDEVQLPPPPPPPPVSGTSTLTSCYPPPPAAAAAQPEAVFQISGEKRPAPMDSGGCEREHRRKRQKTEINTYCCGCSNGPMSSMQVSCVVCEHQFCRNCRTEQYTVF